MVFHRYEFEGEWSNVPSDEMILNSARKQTAFHQYDIFRAAQVVLNSKFKRGQMEVRSYKVKIPKLLNFLLQY